MEDVRLYSKKHKENDTIVKVRNVVIGANKRIIIAGPCAIESRKQTLGAARFVSRAGADIFRGGAFKPRTSPYDFQGLGEKGLEYLAEVRELTDMPICTEVMEPGAVGAVGENVDILQIGSRNMYNYSLLKAVGRTDKPVVLKRGVSATLEEWLLAAEYILSEGNQKVILCERGIRTFARHNRFTLDLSAIPVLKKVTHLPVIVDPSHATGKRDFVSAMSMAALASGADGLMIETHPCPEEALCDGKQSLSPSEFFELMEKLKHEDVFLQAISEKRKNSNKKLESEHNTIIPNL